MQICVETRVLHISLLYRTYLVIKICQCFSHFDNCCRTFTILPFRPEHVFGGWQTPLAVWQHRHDRAALAATPTRLRQIRKTGPGSEKPLTVGPFIKTLISGQLNNNCHILFRKPLLQYGCHDLLCQVWAGLSRMQSLDVHKISTQVADNTARRLRRGCNKQSFTYKINRHLHTK